MKGRRGTRCTICLEPMDLQIFLDNDHVCNECAVKVREWDYILVAGEPVRRPKVAVPEVIYGLTDEALD